MPPNQDFITYVGNTNWRNANQPFGIKEKDRFGHLYAIGKTGVGKSTLLLNMAISDIMHGNGLCVIDPHGDISQTILQYVPLERLQDVVYFNPQDFNYPTAFNPLANIDESEHHLVVSSLISTFKKIWFESWGPRLEYILRFSLLTLLWYPEATLLDIQPILTDINFRNRILDHVRNPHIIEFWKNEFEKYPPALKAEAIAPILNKTGVFLTSIPLRNIVGQRKSSISIPDIMGNKKILIVNLAKGQLGEDTTAILGSMLITAIQVAAMRRSTQAEEDRIPFYLYIDEMHSFVSLSFADMLAESRKYKLSLFLTHQYIEQLHEQIRAAIFGNAGTIISFRVGATDAAYLAKEFEPVFDQEDLINLPKYSMCLKLMIDGATSKPFSADTIKLNESSRNYKEKVISFSRKRYARPKEEVEQEIFKNREFIHRKENLSLFDS